MLCVNCVCLGQRDMRNSERERERRKERGEVVNVYLISELKCGSVHIIYQKSPSFLFKYNLAKFSCPNSPNLPPRCGRA